MPTEAPNTLRSRARYKIIDVISQGPIIGLVNGAKSVFLNETPVQSDNDTLNFKNFDITKDLQELPIPDVDGQLVKRNPALFPLSENDVNVGVKVTKDNPVTRTITDLNLDSVKVTLRIPALAKTNTTTGDVTGNNIDFKIEVKPSGGDFAPIPAARAWHYFNPLSTTPANATGVMLTAELDGVATATWQYRRLISGQWEPWITYSVYNPPWNRKYTVTKSIDGLPPGEHQTRVVILGGSVGSTVAHCLMPNPILIGGKTVSPYDAEYLVQLPGNGPWDIRVTRISDDPATSNIQGDLYWLNYTEQVNSRFSWPNVAGVAITFDAEDFGGQIPTRAYDVMGLIIKIPSNYDPYSRAYSGIWDGTFKEDWTDNPAWIFYDLLTNKRYGLGDNIDAAQIDKFALYQIAQYCDELVDAPNGGQEPRYTCSCVINTQSEAYELLTAIASAFRGMIYHSGGVITPVADMPSDPVLNVGPANVIDGTFTYQGASRKARHTVARVSWNNPDDGYKLNVELYEDADAVRKYGYRPIDINAFGCTSRGLARRWGKWAISSDNDAPDTVTYKAGFDHFKLRPGNVINISDPNYSGEQLFGLIADVTDNVSPATHTIKLDRAVTRVAGDTSELQLTLADGTILALDVSVLTNTTSDEITVDSAELTTIPLAGASWLLKKGTVEPRQWRVISISEDEPHIYQVTAMLYDANKYDKVESDLNFAEADFTAFPSGSMPAPTGIAISEFLKQTGSAILSCATVSWTRPNDPRADWFEVQYQLDGEEWRQTEPNLTQLTSIDILNTVPGAYNFRVRAQDTSGIFRSEWATLASLTLNGKNKKPEDVTGFTATIEKYGVLLSWLPVSDIDINFYEIRKGASWAAGTLVAKVKGTVYKWEDTTEATHTFWIKAVDTSGNYSATEASATVTLVLEAVPSVTAVGVKGGITIEIAGVTTSRFAHYEVQRKQNGAADSTAVTLNALLASRTWTDNTILAYPARYVYRARAFNRNLNSSSYGAWSNAAFSVQIEDADLSADAIKMPSGALLSLTAKNCTTASIAEVGGVKDVSGNGNHGRAYNGVEVVDTEMGKAFRQSGYRHIQCSGAGLTATDRTFSCWIKKTNETNAWAQILAQNTVYNSGTNNNITGLWTDGNGIIRVFAANGVSHGIAAGIVPTPNRFYHVAGVIEGSVALRLYIDGILANSVSLAFNPQTDGLSVFVGGFSATPEFDCFDPRVYNRALSPSEIKTLYMFPDDVAFGQLTADLIGANVIKAQNLIQSEAVITNKAQINSGVFNELLVLDSDFIDTASTAENALSDADTALNTANTALNDANAANTAISNMTDDDKLTPDEKQLAQKEWDIIVSEKSKNDTQADSFGVSKTAYGDAYSALSTYITPLLSDLTTTSDIVGTTFRTKFKDYYDARTDLLNAIATKSKQVADTAKTAVDNWAVAGTNYTEIKGGVITTGQIKSGNYIAPAVEEPILSLTAENSTTESIAEVDGVKDVSGNGNHGQAFGGVEVVDSEMGKAFSFDGVDDYVYTNFGALELNSTDSFTISVWAKCTGGAHEQMVVYSQKPSNARIYFGKYSDRWNFGIGNYTWATSTTLPVVVTGEWIHLVLVVQKSSSTATLYANGNPTLTRTGWVWTDTTADLTLSTSIIYYFDGLIAHPKIFNRALSPSEIKTLYMFPDAPAVGESFAQSGSSYDLDNASITTENFYSNETGAGIKGHIEADSGKIGQWQIDPSDAFLTGGISSQGTLATFGLSTIDDGVMVGRGVKPHPTNPSDVVSSYSGELTRGALLLNSIGFRVLMGDYESIPIGNAVAMTEMFKISQYGVMTFNGYETELFRWSNGYFTFYGVVIAWGQFTSNATSNQIVTLPPRFTEPPQIALTLLTTSTTTTTFARVASKTNTTFTCNSNASISVMYIAIGY